MKKINELTVEQLRRELNIARLSCLPVTCIRFLKSYWAAKLKIEIKKEYEKARKKCEGQGVRMILSLDAPLASNRDEADTYHKNCRGAIVRHRGRVFIQPSALLPLGCLNKDSFKTNFILCKVAFLNLFSLARENCCSLLFDPTESVWGRLVTKAFLEMALYDREAEIGITLQACRRDALSSARRILAVAKKRGRPIHIRLAKDHVETEFPSQLFERAGEVEKNFKALVRFSLKNLDHIHLSLATNSLESITFALGLSHVSSLFEVELTSGADEPLSYVLRRHDIPVSVRFHRVCK